MANAALAEQIRVRVNAWRYYPPLKGEAVKAIDGWVRDAGIAGESDAAAILRQAVAVAERVGTVKSVAPWDEVIAELDAAVKSLNSPVFQAKQILGRFLTQNRGDIQTPGEVDRLTTDIRRALGTDPAIYKPGVYRQLQFLETVGDDPTAIAYAKRLLHELNRK